MKNPLANLCKNFNLDLIEIIGVSVWLDREQSKDGYEIEKFSFSRQHIRAKDIKSFTTSELSIESCMVRYSSSSNGQHIEKRDRKTIETLKLIEFRLENIKDSITGVLVDFSEGVYKKTLDRIISIEVSRKIKGKK